MQKIPCCPRTPQQTGCVAAGVTREHLFGLLVLDRVEVAEHRHPLHRNPVLRRKLQLPKLLPDRKSDVWARLEHGETPGERKTHGAA
jgi:hypothetical protein